MVIVLDRDGVINEDSPQYIKNPDEWIPIPGSLEAIAEFNRAGYKVVIASNQSGLARGFFSAEDLKNIHRKLQQSLAQVGGHVDAIYFCPHHPGDCCECRKPKIGLLKKIAQDFSVNAKEIIFIGDSESDMQAGEAFGCETILVLTGNGEKTLAAYKNKKDFRFGENLFAVKNKLLNN